MSAKRIQPDGWAISPEMLAFRISRSGDELAKVFDQMLQSCDKYIVYQHEADDEISRTHVHGLIEGCKVSTDTLKNWVKKALDVKAFPKTDWSFVTELQGKPVTEDFITYMSKGTLSPIRSSWDEARVDELKNKWSDEYVTRGMKRQFKIVQMLTPQEAKKTYNQMIDDIDGRIGDRDDDRHILEQIVKYVNEKRLIIGRYKIRDMYDTIRCRRKPSTYVGDLMAMCGFKCL